MALTVDYNLSQMREDITALLQSRAGPMSGRPLGNPTNASLYDDRSRITQLWEGVCTAWVRFYRREFPSLRDFARVVLCECAQESTMNYQLGVKPVRFDDHTSHGIIQVTPGSVLKDFAAWGTPISSVLKGRTNVVVADPSTAQQLDTSNMCSSIVIWAWYTSNNVKCRMSLNEHAHRNAWHSTPSEVQQIYGNCLLAWLAGPRNDIDAPSGQRSFEDYYNRICDYYVQSGFGPKASFDQHMRTTLQGPLRFLQKQCLDGTAA